MSLIALAVFPVSFLEWTNTNTCWEIVYNLAGYVKKLLTVIINCIIMKFTDLLTRFINPELKLV